MELSLKNNIAEDRKESSDKKAVDFSISEIDTSERILLLPHCMKNSEKCKALSSTWGLQCRQCDPQCQVNILKTKAHELGYKGVCVASGGSMALRYIEETRPLGVVAVACPVELKQGLDGVKNISEENKKYSPVVVVISLIKNGCVDTLVDIEEALEVVSSGC